MHTRYLRMVLGVGSKVDHDVLRAEACSPVTTRTGLPVSSTSGMSEYEWGHDGEVWKDDVLMLLGRNKC